MALCSLVIHCACLGSAAARPADLSLSPPTSSVQRPIPDTSPDTVMRGTLRLDVEKRYPTRLEIESRYPTLLEVDSAYPTVLGVERRYPARRVATVDRTGALGRVHNNGTKVVRGRGHAGHARARARPYAAPPPRNIEAPAVALTFDTEIPHGEEASHTLTTVLDTLRDAGVRSTFFVVGWWARANPNMLRRMIAEGHEVASHSFTHQRFENRSVSELRTELQQVADVVLRETGSPIAPLFRPPYGCIDASAVRLLQQDGYRLAGWTASGRDARSKTRTPREVVAAVRAGLRRGGVLLLHTNHWITAAALPEILHLIDARGWKAVTVSELLRRNPATATRLARSGLRDCTLRPRRVAAGLQAGAH
ncbi:MAG: polysaccharide deacetylase family protein [Candidatus Binatia bacterium]